MLGSRRLIRDGRMGLDCAEQGDEINVEKRSAIARCIPSFRWFAAIDGRMSGVSESGGGRLRNRDSLGGRLRGIALF